jgi:F-type H+-transporting ATPase subunit delta
MRYARALFELAREENRLSAVEADARSLSDLFQNRETFDRLMDPRIVLNRAAIWNALLGGKVDPLTLRFILFTLAKGRGVLLPQILADFLDLCYESRGIQPIEIVSATPLSESQIQKIVERVGRRLRCEVHPSVRINRDLIGGFIVRVRDTIYDFSLNQMLQRVHRSLLTA